MPLPPYPQLIQQAQALGFEKAALLTFPDLTQEAEHLSSWLNLGFYGEMTWMQTHFDKRKDPLSLMPGTQSILCVAINYYPGEIPENTEYKIARYAHGDDYHDVVKKKLKQLLAWLKTFEPSIEGRPLTDSAPILEKALAVKAGLGWQGKHSNLITKDVGSWVFLGELLLNVTFPDAPTPEPMADFCGRCRRCIDACPTQAIVDNAVVDATKCISYWTIESKQPEFPASIRENLSGWLFGCDICQEVCPWNQKFQVPTAEPAFASRPWNKTVHSAEIKDMTPEQFSKRYRKSPVKRVKLAGLKRNLAMLEKR